MEGGEEQNNQVSQVVEEVKETSPPTDVIEDTPMAVSQPQVIDLTQVQNEESVEEQPAAVQNSDDVGSKPPSTTEVKPRQRKTKAIKKEPKIAAVAAGTEAGGRNSGSGATADGDDSGAGDGGSGKPPARKRKPPSRKENSRSVKHTDGEESKQYVVTGTAGVVNTSEGVIQDNPIAGIERGVEIPLKDVFKQILDEQYEKIKSANENIVRDLLAKRNTDKKQSSDAGRGDTSMDLGGGKQLQSEESVLQPRANDSQQNLIDGGRTTTAPGGGPIGRFGKFASGAPQRSTAQIGQLRSGRFS